MLQPITGEHLSSNTNANDEARLDVSARGFWEAHQMAFFDMGGCRLMLSNLPEPEHDHPASVLYFMVDNIQDVYQTLKDKGVLFEDTPHFIAKEPQGDLWMTFFRDPEHNLLALMSYQS